MFNQSILIRPLLLQQFVQYYYATFDRDRSELRALYVSLVRVNLSTIYVF